VGPCGARRPVTLVSMDPALEPVEPLRERLPGYMAVFGMGAAAATLVGVVVWLATRAALAEAVGYSLIGLGTLLLLIGGARGGGYTNLGIGAVEALVGGRNRMDDDYVSDEELRRGRVYRKRDPMARLRRGLRPPANPTAFWQVVAGLAYAAAGAALTLLSARPG